MTWLMRTAVAPSVLDGILILQTTGSPVPALLALAAPIFRPRLSKDNDHD